MREMLEIWCLQQGHQVEVAADGGVALERLEVREFDLVITDLRMPRAQGLDVLRACKSRYPDTPVIVMTAYASAETAMEAIKLGALDYFTKPFRLDTVAVVVQRALERRRLVKENRTLRAELAGRARLGALIGRSDAMREVFDLVRRVAATRANVLILGESGTGKELIARAVHTESERRAAPFLVVNCGAIPENLLESELFGHRKGAFTGATADRDGMFQAAEGGTLFLDEVGELPAGMQVKLLRVLQERKVRPVGHPREITVDVRVIAATNRDLAADVRAGLFREDLYYRLNVLCVELPPLRARPADIGLLAHHFLGKYTAEFGKAITDISPDALKRLVEHRWRGNVRELENVIERAVALADGGRVEVADLPPALRAPAEPSEVAPAPDEFPEDGVDLDAAVAELERRLITQALDRTGGQKKAAARLLGVTFRSLRYRLEKLGM
ncbi:MAG: sigma-54-dependent Fis family transcriptional regulator [Myxococcales bacterium]|nr:sigma-54-dependent Fis family transcriptional regulator [Myxococcales bacterium]